MVSGTIRAPKPIRTAQPTGLSPTEPGGPAADGQGSTNAATRHHPVGHRHTPGPPPRLGGPARCAWGPWAQLFSCPVHRWAQIRLGPLPLHWRIMGAVHLQAKPMPSSARDGRDGRCVWCRGTQWARNRPCGVGVWVWLQDRCVVPTSGLQAAAVFPRRVPTGGPLKQGTRERERTERAFRKTLAGYTYTARAGYTCTARAGRARRNTRRVPKSEGREHGTREHGTRNTPIEHRG